MEVMLPDLQKEADAVAAFRSLVFVSVLVVQEQDVQQRRVHVQWSRLTGGIHLNTLHKSGVRLGKPAWKHEVEAVSYTHLTLPTRRTV